jgi:hypothetical protein
MRAATVLVGAGVVVVSSGCPSRGPCEGAACETACPVDAVRASGRCTCADQRFPVFGACLEPHDADAYCGGAARAGRDGCSFRGCRDGEVLDLATGTCLPRDLVRGGASCPAGAEHVVEQGHASCISAADACPRGTTRTDSGGLCAGPPRCPAGTVAASADERHTPRTVCWPIVASTPRGPRVDVGTWVASAIGPDGGRGTDVLCRPMAQRPAAFGVGSEQSLEVSVRVAFAIPDQELTRVRALVRAEDAATESPLPAPAISVVRASVETLVGALRGLGGEASAAAVDVNVRCTVRSL